MNNYDEIQKAITGLVKVSGNQSISISELNDNAKRLNEGIKQVNTLIESVSDDVANIQEWRKEIDDFKEDELNNRPISNTQSKTMRTALQKRIYEVIEKHNICDGDISCYGFVIKEAWWDLKRTTPMGSSYKDTPRKYYDQVMEAIEAWVPTCGFPVLKEKVANSLSEHQNKEVKKMIRNLQLIGELASDAKNVNNLESYA